MDKSMNESSQKIYEVAKEGILRELLARDSLPPQSSASGDLLPEDIDKRVLSCVEAAATKVRLALEAAFQTDVFPSLQRLAVSVSEPGCIGAEPIPIPMLHEAGTDGKLRSCFHQQEGMTGGSQQASGNRQLESQNRQQECYNRQHEGMAGGSRQATGNRQQEVQNRQQEGMAGRSQQASGNRQQGGPSMQQEGYKQRRSSLPPANTPWNAQRQFGPKHSLDSQHSKNTDHIPNGPVWRSASYPMQEKTDYTQVIDFSSPPPTQLGHVRGRLNAPPPGYFGPNPEQTTAAHQKLALSPEQELLASMDSPGGQQALASSFPSPAGRVLNNPEDEAADLHSLLSFLQQHGFGGEDICGMPHSDSLLAKLSLPGNLSSRDLMRGLSLPSQTPTAPRQKATHFPKPPLPLRGSANSFSLMSDPSSTLYQSPSDFQAAMRQFTTPEHSAQFLQQLSSQQMHQLSSQDLSSQQLQPLSSQQLQQLSSQDLSSQHLQPLSSQQLQQLSNQDLSSQHLQPLSSQQLQQLSSQDLSSQQLQPLSSQQLQQLSRQQLSSQDLSGQHVSQLSHHFSKQTAMLMQQMSAEQGHGMHPRLSSGHLPAPRNFSGQGSMHMPTQAVAGHPRAPQNFSSPGSTHVPPSPVSGALDYALNPEAGHSPAHRTFSGPSCMHMPPPAVSGHPPGPQNFSSPGSMHMPPSPVSGALDYPLSSEAARPMWSMPMGMQPGHLGFLPPPSHGFPDSPLPSPPGFNPEAAAALGMDMIPEHLRCLPTVVWWRIMHLVEASSAVTLQDFDEKVVLKMVALIDRFGQAECLLMLEQLEARLTSKHISMKNAAGYLDVAVNGHIDALMMRSNTTAVSSSVNPTCIEEVARTTLTPMVFDALSAAVRSKRWMKWDEHIDLAIVQLLKRLPADTAVQRLNEVQRRSFHGVGNVRGCINSIICPRSKERTVA